MTSTHKKKPQSGARRAEANAENHSGSNSTRRGSATEAQRERILRALRRRPQTTEDLRRLGIFVVPARMKELRDRYGYDIETTRITLVDRDGYSHPRCALYSLRAEKGRRDA